MRTARGRFFLYALVCTSLVRHVIADPPIPGYTAWFDGTDPTNGAGAYVAGSCWKGKAGQTPEVCPPTPSSAPTYDPTKFLFQFSGSQYFTQTTPSNMPLAPGAYQLTYSVVYSGIANANGMTIVSQTGVKPGTRSCLFVGSGNEGFSGEGNDCFKPGWPLSPLQIVVMVVDGTSVTLYHADVTAGTPTVTTTTCSIQANSNTGTSSFDVGATNRDTGNYNEFLSGDVGAVIVHPLALSAADANHMVTYLNSIWCCTTTPAPSTTTTMIAPNASTRRRHAVLDCDGMLSHGAPTFDLSGLESLTVTGTCTAALAASTPSVALDVSRCTTPLAVAFRGVHLVGTSVAVVSNGCTGVRFLVVTVISSQISATLPFGSHPLGSGTSSVLDIIASTCGTTAKDIVFDVAFEVVDSMLTSASSLGGASIGSVYVTGNAASTMSRVEFVSQLSVVSASGGSAGAAVMSIVGADSLTNLTAVDVKVTFSSTTASANRGGTAGGAMCGVATIRSDAGITVSRLEVVVVNSTLSTTANFDGWLGTASVLAMAGSAVLTMSKHVILDSTLKTVGGTMVSSSLYVASVAANLGVIGGMCAASATDAAALRSAVWGELPPSVDATLAQYSAKDALLLVLISGSTLSVIMPSCVAVNLAVVFYSDGGCGYSGYSSNGFVRFGSLSSTPDANVATGRAVFIAVTNGSAMTATTTKWSFAHNIAACLGAGNGLVQWMHLEGLIWIADRSVLTAYAGGNVVATNVGVGFCNWAQYSGGGGVEWRQSNHSAVVVWGLGTQVSASAPPHADTGGVIGVIGMTMRSFTVGGVVRWVVADGATLSASGTVLGFSDHVAQVTPLQLATSTTNILVLLCGATLNTATWADYQLQPASLPVGTLTPWFVATTCDTTPPNPLVSTIVSVNSCPAASGVADKTQIALLDASPVTASAVSDLLGANNNVSSIPPSPCATALFAAGGIFSVDAVTAWAMAQRSALHAAHCAGAPCRTASATASGSNESPSVSRSIYATASASHSRASRSVSRSIGTTEPTATFKKSLTATVSVSLTAVLRPSTQVRQTLIDLSTARLRVNSTTPTPPTLNVTPQVTSSDIAATPAPPSALNAVLGGAAAAAVSGTTSATVGIASALGGQGALAARAGNSDRLLSAWDCPYNDGLPDVTWNDLPLIVPSCLQCNSFTCDDHVVVASALIFQSCASLALTIGLVVVATAFAGRHHGVLSVAQNALSLDVAMYGVNALQWCVLLVRYSCTSADTLVSFATLLTHAFVMLFIIVVIALGRGAAVQSDADLEKRRGRRGHHRDESLSQRGPNQQHHKVALRGDKSEEDDEAEPKLPGQWMTYGALSIYYEGVIHRERIDYRLAGCVDFVAAAVLSLISGMKPTAAGPKCQAVAASMAAVPYFVIAYVVVRRPLREFQETGFMFAAWSLDALIGSISTYLAFDATHLETALKITGSIDLAKKGLLMIQSIILVVVVVRKFIHRLRGTSARRSDRAEVDPSTRMSTLSFRESRGRRLLSVPFADGNVVEVEVPLVPTKQDPFSMRAASLSPPRRPPPPSYRPHAYDHTSPRSKSAAHVLPLRRSGDDAPHAPPRSSYYEGRGGYDRGGYDRGGYVEKRADWRGRRSNNPLSPLGLRGRRYEQEVYQS